MTHNYKSDPSLFNAPRPDDQQGRRPPGIISMEQYRCTQCGDTCDMIEAKRKIDANEECVTRTPMAAGAM